MREIKFRAWDGFNKRMIYEPFTIRTCASGVIELNFPSYLQRWDSIMQYTGLHDKNGKEIYEGDICKHVSGKPEINSIEYYCGEWHLEPHGLHLSDENEAVEVIGNIYENPDLL